jgi:DNA-binding MarR family transcriptional regulator
MAASKDLLKLDDILNDLAKLYQFRSLDDRVYGALTVSQWYSLRLLFFQGARTMGQLAANLGVRLSTMTGVIDQLERRGFVERVDHPEDRRSLRVELTAKGRKLYHAAHQAFLSHLEPLFEGLTPTARKGILDFLAVAVRVIQGWRANPRDVRHHGKSKSERRGLRRAARADHLRAVRVGDATAFDMGVPDPPAKGR